MIMLKMRGEVRRYFLQCDSCSATRKFRAPHLWILRSLYYQYGWRSAGNGKLICPACQRRKENR